jgi:hypothetical protein
MNNKGQQIAQVGDNIKMGGGEYNPGDGTNILDVTTGQFLADHVLKAEKPHWYASSVEFYPFFPVYSIAIDKRSKFTSAVEGTLILEQGYLRLNDASGNCYLLIWPLEWDIRKQGGHFYIHGVKNSPQIGSKVIIRGEEFSAASLKKVLLFPLPDHWKGPFWITTEISLQPVN